MYNFMVKDHFKKRLSIPQEVVFSCFKPDYKIEAAAQIKKVDMKL